MRDREPAATAERAREVEEERVYAREVRGGASKAAIGKVLVHHTAKAVREWIRSQLLPDAIIRLYDIGMGIETFETPTAVGSVVRVEAPAAVQQKALATLIAIGVPTQMGLTDGLGNALPGVFALGPLDLDAARQEAHGDRYVEPEAHARAMAALYVGDSEAGIADAAMDAMRGRVVRGEFEVVEVVEGVGSISAGDADAPPGALADMETPERAALRAHRERMERQKRTGNSLATRHLRSGTTGNRTPPIGGNGNGGHP